ncbi:uncharacterized protein OCT59_022254 [Rhizophagus irregularis]|uniref:Uncharacterized protein n=1 Tax=Rhizophagus irregularis TaxID=588596 RepID=A0A915ZG23_9GLOM|nr:hypothetical protein OCT59_022254 [Rhizophagus irregularis]CAB5373234.1 unnamed protein product [Rhizophagus irregularis]
MTKCKSRIFFAGRENVGGTVTDQEMDINKDVDEDDTEVQVQPNTSRLTENLCERLKIPELFSIYYRGETASDRMSYNAKVLTKPIEETKG